MNTAIQQSPIKISSSAMRQLQRIKEEQGLTADHGLRVGVKGGGCAGFSYVLGFDVQKDKDQLYEADGLTILMEKAHGIYLIGMEIDWHEGLNNRGFVFNNPNATESCGCGESFSA
ncbi:MAG: iron-sulfur cluster assembly accessory protein [Bacteroidota bacterium]